MDEERLSTNSDASIWPPAPTSAPLVLQYPPEDGIETFPPQNIFLVLLYSFLSLGIYSVVWLSQQARRINPSLPDEGIDSTFLIVVLVSVVLAAGLDIVNIFVDNSVLDTATKIMDRISALLVLFLTFQVRGRIHRLLGARQNSPYRYSALGTFFFGIVYLQFKINRNLERWQRERPFETV